MSRIELDDFHLDQSQLILINNYIDEQNSLFSHGREDLPINIQFKFDKNGRLVEVCVGEDDRGIRLS